MKMFFITYVLLASTVVFANKKIGLVGSWNLFEASDYLDLNSDVCSMQMKGNSKANPKNELTLEILSIKNDDQTLYSEPIILLHGLAIDTKFKPVLHVLNEKAKGQKFNLLPFKTNEGLINAWVVKFAEREKFFDFLTQLNKLEIKITDKKETAVDTFQFKNDNTNAAFEKVKSACKFLL